MKNAWNIGDTDNKEYLAVVQFNFVTRKYVRVENERAAIAEAAFMKRGISLLLTDGNIVTTSQVATFDGLNIRTNSRWYINGIDQMLV